MTSTIVHSAGSSGYLVAPFAVTSTLMLSAAPSAGFFLSTASFNQTNTGGAIQGQIWFAAFSTSPQQLAGSNLAGWFVHSDASGNFETTSTVAGMGRNPDFVIPLPSTSTTILSTGVYFANGYALLPWDNFKIFVQNNLGLTLGTTFGQIYIGPVVDDIV